MVYIMHMYVNKRVSWARSAGNSAIENVCIIIIKHETHQPRVKKKEKKEEEKNGRRRRKKRSVSIQTIVILFVLV